MKNLVGAVIDCALFDEQEKRKDRIRSGKWSPSSLGRCYRNQVWNRQDKPHSNPVPVGMLRVFKCGDIFHQFVQELFPDAKKEVKVETDCLLGFADIVLDDEVVELKSINTWQFPKLKARDYDVDKFQYHHILQVMAYAHYLGASKGRLVYIDKNSLETLEFSFITGEWEEDVRRELAILNSFWERGELPKAEPRAYLKKRKDGTVVIQDCEYCVFADACGRVENGHQ